MAVMTTTWLKSKWMIIKKPSTRMFREKHYHMSIEKKEFTSSGKLQLIGICLQEGDNAVIINKYNLDKIGLHEENPSTKTAEIVTCGVLSFQTQTSKQVC